MKIIKLSDFKSDTDFSIDVIPDSALQKSSKPFFVPEFADHFSGSVFVAVHICRLGKNIARKFAHRYYDECGLCLAITADTLLDELKSKNKAWSMATAFDSSIIIGDVCPVSDFMGLSSLSISFADNGVEIWKTEISDIDIRFNMMIEYVSRFFTLKIGDIILIDIEEPKYDITIGSHLAANINDKNSLDVRIK